MKREYLPVVLVLLFLWGAPTQAQERGVRLLLEPPAAPLPQGGKGTLAITLADAAGTPRAAEQDLTIELKTGPDLLPAKDVVLSVGETRVDVPLEPSRPGAWIIQAIARGVFGESALVVCVEPADAGDAPPPPPPSPEEATVPEGQTPPGGDLEAGRPEIESQVALRPTAFLAPEEVERRLVEDGGVRPKLAARVLARNQRVLLPPKLTPRGTDTEGEEPTVEGRLVLKPELSEVRRGPDGLYRSSLHALWFEGAAPSPRTQALDLELLFEPATSDRLAEPALLSLPSGGVNTKAEIRSDSAGDVQVLALYGQHTSEPVRVRFLPPKAAALAFTRPQYSLRGLASAQLDVVVQLLDAEGLSLLVEGRRKISLSLESEGGVETHELEIAPGDFQATAKLRVSRFGSHTLRAISPGLEPALATVHLRLEYLLLVVALLGGMVGSVTRLLFTRQGNAWKKGLARALALGVVAALLALLLALFQVLKSIEDVLVPGLGGALSSLPFQNPLAVFLIGLIAGLGLETLFVFFTGRKAKALADS